MTESSRDTPAAPSHRPLRLALGIAAALVLLVAVFFAGEQRGRDAAASDSAAGADTRKPAAAKLAARDAPPRASQAGAAAPIVRAPLPPAGTPLKDSFAELLARAQAGDADAASRLYRDLARCADVANTNATVPHMAAHYLNEKTDKLTPDQLKGRDGMLSLLDDRLKRAAANATLCAGLSDDQTQQLTPATLIAAQLGDTDAATCYIGNEMQQRDGLLTHPEWLVDFRDNAVAVANNAVAHGNWTVVKHLAFSYNNVFRGSLLSQATGDDPAMAYRYYRLWQLGAGANDASQYVNENVAEVGAKLSPEQIASADAWAQSTYRDAFNGNTTTAQNGNVTNHCGID